jgi:flagellar biosynthetic protein FlhB
MIFNVLQGMKRIFGSARSAVELAKSIVKLLLVGAVLFQVLNRRADEIVALAAQPYQHIGALIGSVIMELLWKIGAIYLLIGAADLFFQRYKFKDDLKMTKQEVKEETKQSEGDVEVKARLRQLAKQRLKRIMLQNVKKADVVIVNPTHYAVALEYKPGMNAPKVLAKGADFLALKIRELAAEHNVPVVENPPLARALYAAVEVDAEIPENLFKTVAQVLAYIYRQRKKGA